MELYDAPKPINSDEQISSQEYELNFSIIQKEEV